MQTTQNWAVRCLHESQQHKQNAFLTLTIDPNFGIPHEDPSCAHQDMCTVGKSVREFSTVAPSAAFKLRGNIARVDNSLTRKDIEEELLHGSLNKNTHQKFMKRLRHYVPKTVRYFMCGEYGDKLLRPHYHYLLFGHQFEDKYYWKTSPSGEHLYRSSLLEKIWPFGHAWIGEVTYQSCAYVAAYVQKKVTGKKAWEHYKRIDQAGNEYWLQPEFALMSRGGKGGRGIAANWFDQFHTDVYTDDVVITQNRKMKPPRYYDKLLSITDPTRWEELKFLREQRAKLLTEDNTPARLDDKEKVAIAKHKLKKRNLEKP